MNEWQAYLEIIKNIGFPAIIFIIWYIYHRSQVEFYKEVLKNQEEREKRNFEILQEMTEAMQRTVAILSRMEYKIDSNSYCPISKELKK